MNIRRIIFGEPTPDKNDPRYRERYERERAAGERFAQTSGISKAAVYFYRWAVRHRQLFLGLVIGFVFIVMLLNIIFTVQAYRSFHHPKAVDMKKVEQSINPQRSMYYE